MTSTILNNKVKITGLLITFNEEKHIAEAIENLSFLEEIIVVDSFSTDKTVSILQTFPRVKVIQRKFTNFSDQRNFAIDQATKDWILFIDADERLSNQLISEITEIVSIPNNIVAYKVHRKFMFKEKMLHFSGHQTDYIFRLFKRGRAYYNPKQKVHETLIPQGPTATLKNEMMHYSYDNYNSYKSKIEHYAYLNALEHFERGKKPTWFAKNIKPAYKFLYNYIFRLGILDGEAGYIICKLYAHGVKYRYKKLEELLLGSPKQ